MKTILDELDMTYNFVNMSHIDINLLSEKLAVNAQDKWKLSVEAKPKLLTYRSFKTELKAENYLKANLDRYERSLVAQF